MLWIIIPALLFAFWVGVQVGAIRANNRAIKMIRRMGNKS